MDWALVGQIVVAIVIAASLYFLFLGELGDLAQLADVVRSLFRKLTGRPNDDASDLTNAGVWVQVGCLFLAALVVGLAVLDQVVFGKW